MKKRLLNLALIVCVASSYGQTIDVNVDDNALMYIKEGSFVYVSNSGDVNIDDANNAELIMDSNETAYSNLYVDGSSTGKAEYRLWAPDAAWARDFVSSPLPGQLFNDFANDSDNANLADGTIVGGAKLFGPFNNNSNTYFEWAATSTNPIEAGYGYRTAVSTVGGGQLMFKHNIKTDGAAVTVTFGTSGFFRYQNIIGNPYTTYISARDLITEFAASQALNTSNIAVYGWNNTSGSTSAGNSDGEQWDVISLSSLNDVSPSYDRLIPPGQAFVVVSDNDGQDETVTFAETMRRVSRTGNGFLPNDPDPSSRNFNGGQSSYNSTTTANLIGKFKINLVDQASSVEYNTQMMFFDNNVSRGLDPAWDVAKTSMGRFAGIGSLLADNSNTLPFRIQCLDQADINGVSTDVVIPLRVKAQGNKSYSINMVETVLPSGAEVYLEDTLTNTYTLLNNSNYTFTPSSNIDSSSRFFLRFADDRILNVEDVDFEGLTIRSLENKKTIVVLGKLNNDTKVNLIDMTGRIVNSYIIENSFGGTQHEIDVTDLATGPYVVTLSDEEGRTKEVKLIIN